MDREFSVDEMADPFWLSYPPIRPTDEEEGEANKASSSAAPKAMRMIRSPSEWAFQRFIQETASPEQSTTTIQSSETSLSRNPPQNDDVLEIIVDKDSGAAAVNSKDQLRGVVSGGPPADIPTDSEEFQAYLKSRLELACAAVALTRASNGNAQKLSSEVAPDNAFLASNALQLGSHVTFKASGIAMHPLPAISRKSGASVKPTTSVSSGEPSDDDEVDGENETNRSMGPTDAKRERRMLSNRESARRSRRRKQAHLTELETKVSKVKNENSSLLKRFTDITNKYNEAAVDNRVLKADVETLRAKVKMAEETVKRVTGVNPLFQAMSEISTMATPSFVSSPDTTSPDAPVPLHNDPKQNHYYHAPSSSHAPEQDFGIQNGLVDVGPANSLQTNAMAAGGATSRKGRTVNLGHLQKHIRGASGSTDIHGSIGGDQ